MNNFGVKTIVSWDLDTGRLGKYAIRVVVNSLWTLSSFAWKKSRYHFEVEVPTKECYDLKHPVLEIPLLKHAGSQGKKQLQRVAEIWHSSRDQPATLGRNWRAGSESSKNMGK